MSDNNNSPRLTVDMIVRMIDKPNSVLLIKRKNPPYGWAIPGGFVEIGETLEEAVEREIREETSLTVDKVKQFHAYSDPSRDPRGHTVSVVFTGEGKGVPEAMSDAENIRIFSIEELPRQLAFDHSRILDDYFKEFTFDD